MGPPGADMGPPGMMGGPGMFPAVKLRGLPFDVTEDDVRMFLGCDPVDILMVRRDGRLSGEAFIVLSSPMHVDLALSKNRSYLGRRYVEVYRAKKSDYYRAVSAEVMEGGGPGMQMHHGGGGYGGGYDQGPGGYGGGPMHGGGGDRGGGYSGGQGILGETTILKLRGLPFSVQDDDIIRWFDDPSVGVSPLTGDSVFIVHEGGRPNGIAFVEFPTPQEASAAMVKNKQMMGSRYVEIFPANRTDLERYRARG